MEDKKITKEEIREAFRKRTLKLIQKDERLGTPENEREIRENVRLIDDFRGLPL
jgi:hypothetical protein